MSGSTGNSYSGGTTINRGAVYLAKTGGAIAVPGNVTVACSSTPTPGQTF